MTFPRYRRLDRYRPARRIGPFLVHWTPDHLPLPRVHAYRGGTSLELGFSIGPLGPDPVLSIDVTIPRPGRLA